MAQTNAEKQAAWRQRRQAKMLELEGQVADAELRLDLARTIVRSMQTELRGALSGQQTPLALRAGIERALKAATTAAR